MNTNQAGAVPPPLPPRNVPTALPPPRKGMSGCLIALIVIAALAVPVLAILAAIALPAYNDYTVRAKVQQALTQIEPLKQATANFRQQNQRCPRSGDRDFVSTALIPEQSLPTAVTRDEDGDGACVLTLTLLDHSAALHRRQLRLTFHPDRGGWTCSSDLKPVHLPNACRNDPQPPASHLRTHDATGKSEHKGE